MASIQTLLCPMALMLIMFSPIVSPHDITDILNEHPEYAVLRSLMINTKLSDDINIRQGVTVLVVQNREAGDNLLKRSSNMRISTAKNVMRLHVILEYWNMDRIKSLANGSSITPTLFESSGLAPTKRVGFLNLTYDTFTDSAFFTDMATQNSSPSATRIIKTVYDEPSDISVFEVDKLLMPSIVTDIKLPERWELNITDFLIQKGYTKFAMQMKETGLDEKFMNSPDGMTLLVPEDKAFDQYYSLSSESSSSQVLTHHVLPYYTPMSTLLTTNERLKNLATVEARKNGRMQQAKGEFVVQGADLASEDGVTVSSRVSKNAVTGTILDDAPYSILSVDRLIHR